jgi:RNA polymerase sigma-70 factor, ECF subfamily
VTTLSGSRGDSFLEDLRRGAPSSFEAFFDTYAPRALAIARTWTHAESSAEDIVQDAFLRVLARLPDSDIERFEPWFWQVVHNCAVDFFRKERRWRRENPIHSEPSTELDSDDRVMVALAVRGLPPQLRAAVTLRYLADLSEADAAQILGWRIGTLKSRLHRARLQLARALQLADGSEE